MTLFSSPRKRDFGVNTEPLSAGRKRVPDSCPSDYRLLEICDEALGDDLGDFFLQFFGQLRPRRTPRMEEDPQVGPRIEVADEELGPNAQARGGVLRGQGFASVERIKPPFESRSKTTRERFHMSDRKRQVGLKQEGEDRNRV